jgi:hypothetical protein
LIIKSFLGGRRSWKKKIALMVIIFSCVTCVFLSQGAQACWTFPGYQYECRFKCWEQVNCTGKCAFNFWCLLHPLRCLFTSGTLLDNGETKLDVFGQMRNIRIGRTAFGRSLIKLYYKHSLEITSILLSDEELLSFVTPVISEIAEKAIAFNNYEKVSIDREFIEDILAVADLINEKASPELKAAIQRVTKQIKSGYIFRSFGITVDD